MKNLIVLSIAIVLGSSSLFAFNNNPTIKNPERKIRNQVAVLLENPQINVEQEELKAAIQFTLNSNGEIVVLSVDTKNDAVSNYVKTRLNYKRLDPNTPSTGNKIFNIKLRIQKPKA